MWSAKKWTAFWLVVQAGWTWSYGVLTHSVYDVRLDLGYRNVHTDVRAIDRHIFAVSKLLLFGTGSRRPPLMAPGGRRLRDILRTTGQQIK